MRLPGAIRYTGDHAALPRDREIVVYDSDPNEIASTHVVAELIRLGYRAAALKGGISDGSTPNCRPKPKQRPSKRPPSRVH